MIYLDYNATALMNPEVIDEITRVMNIGGNPSSVHALGRGAKAILEDARKTIAQVVNCRPQKVIFTGGGTEANNIALKATGMNHIITGTTEHDSVIGISTNFEGTVEYLAVDENGLILPQDLQKILKDAPEKTLVSIMLANNETGVVQDIKTLADITHEAGALFHTDAIQALGKIPVDFRSLGVDMMSFTAHKLSGPQGVGALVALEKIDIHPIIFGGGQEVGRRSGTENLAGIAGFAKAVDLVPLNLKIMDKLKIMRDRIEKELSEYTPDVIFYGAKSERLPNTSTILMPSVSSETQVMAFDLDGICVSSGSACASGKVKPSHVVSAMGASQDQALSTIRVSLGWKTTEQDVDCFIAAWIKLYKRKKK